MTQRTGDSSYALIVLLPLFGLIAIMALTMELTAPRKTYMAEEGALASQPHSPAEFAEILNIDPLEGLENESSARYPVPPPPLSEEYWPCSQCHEASSDNPRRRELEEHTNIVLNHGDESRWCLDCHSFQNRDRLRLINQEEIDFTESYLLCGQCHGNIYRDWRLGIHGKRTGYWNGAKRYLLCAHCHFPHDPKFKPLKPLPPPVRPQYLRPGTPRPRESPSPSEASHG
ncbi:MAG TPA: hypothetical protein VNO81_11420 [Candidatus Nitrosotenuis sp.]|nr:hypothetical protein [Candidatus Nitrosotenuis sp.]